MLQEFQKNCKYLMLALDHRGSFKKFVNPAAPDSVSDDDVINAKRLIIEAVRDDFSGLLIDADLGLRAYENPDKPFLLCLEKTGYTDEAGERITELQYSAGELKKMGASGAKILLYFNPASESACVKQLQTAGKALEECGRENVPLFLEIVTYGNEALGKTRAEWVIKSVERFVAEGIAPDVFKLEYPGDAKSCKKITKMLGATPWILLTRGEQFDVFEKQLKVAAKNGAVGFLAGRAIWQEIGDYPDNEARKHFLDTVAAERFRKICRILA